MGEVKMDRLHFYLLRLRRATLYFKLRHAGTLSALTSTSIQEVYPPCRALITIPCPGDLDLSLLRPQLEMLLIVPILTSQVQILHSVSSPPCIQAVRDRVLACNWAAPEDSLQESGGEDLQDTEEGTGEDHHG